MSNEDRAMTMGFTYGMTVVSDVINEVRTDVVDRPMLSNKEFIDLLDRIQRDAQMKANVLLGPNF